MDERVAALREILETPELRIELGIAFSVSQGASACAMFYTRQSGRWKLVDHPALLPPEGGKRSDLLRAMADLLDAEMESQNGEQATV